LIPVVGVESAEAEFTAPHIGKVASAAIAQRFFIPLLSIFIAFLPFVAFMNP